MEVPDRPISFVPAEAGETISLGPALKLRVMEDGSNTGKHPTNKPGKRPSTQAKSPVDMRLSAVELIIPPRTAGPRPHWHEMHDETFLVTKGTVRFHIPGKPDVDASAGDYVVVPTRSPHTFSNSTDEEARFFNTFTPAFYINYFKILGEFAKEGGLTPEVNKKAMAYFATLPVPEP
ncbi:hypothetical protein N7468_005027 [Penicillium chermesinum]|uniref:Cupin type-2 domain-containing protein n=1 Tax=Penicillium chermesinum TaxID=63820 RepID=A0A9W9TMK8_9EURO|nr:uncharacterized protein N7468_005027 [Penicillium chermesinum]KAJ5232071.1 hypothetical protein N7468_005027 [Penicillium chermesinum]KAJ6171737.1 hypothetical protein N7470_000804 [Penicillium chermesinum]